MPDEPIHDTDINRAMLDDEAVTYTSADQSAEKTRKPATLADRAEGRSATEHTVDRVEREK